MEGGEDRLCGHHDEIGVNLTFLSKVSQHPKSKIKREKSLSLHQTNQ